MNLSEPSTKSSKICMGCVGKPAGTIVLQKHFLALMCHDVATRGGMNELVGDQYTGQYLQPKRRVKGGAPRTV